MNIVIFEDSKMYGNILINKTEALLRKIDRKSEIMLCTHDIYKIMRFINKTTESLLFFLDICVGRDNHLAGIELAQTIKEKNANHMIVFITNYPDTIRYDIQAKINSFAYIAKNSPLFDYELESVLSATYGAYIKNNLVIKNQYCLIHSISFDSIYTIEAVKGKHKAGVYHANGYVETYESLKSIMERLDKRFIYCNRSCIVNIEKTISLNIGLYTREITTCDNRIHAISLEKLGEVNNAFKRNYC